MRAFIKSFYACYYKIIPLLLITKVFEILFYISYVKLTREVYVLWVY